MPDQKSDTTVTDREHFRALLAVELKEVAAIDPTRLLRIDLSGFSNSSFEEIAPYFDLIYLWVEALRTENLDGLSDDQVLSFREHLANLRRAYDEILKLPNSQAVDRHHRRTLISLVKDSARPLGVIAFSSLPKTAARSLAAESLQQIESMALRGQAALAEIEKAKADAVVALDSVR